jgi:transposase
MPLSIPTSTWTGPVSSFTALRPGLESKDIVGINEPADPIHVPIGMTVEPGNLNDQMHFKKTYRQSRDRPRESSLVVFDKRTNGITNTHMIRAGNLQYITGKKLNKSNDKIIVAFETYHPQDIDGKSRTRGIKIEKPSSVNYLYFSENLQNI